MEGAEWAAKHGVKVLPVLSGFGELFCTHCVVITGRIHDHCVAVWCSTDHQEKLQAMYKAMAMHFDVALGPMPGKSWEIL